MTGRAIALSDVTKRFGATVALDGVTLTAPAEQTTALIGPSGCGKSTLLRLVNGLLLPDTGTVTVGGEPVVPSRLQRLRHQIGYVIQEGGLFPHRTARANVTLLAEHLGWSAERRAQRIAELCALVQLPPDRLDDFPQQLSGGQRQRVSLMRALMLDPPILLLDEPLGALDPMIRADLQRDLRNIMRDLGKTVLLVTHDMGEAAYLGDTVVLMRAGRIVQQGPPDALLDAPAEPFVEAFISAQRSPLDR